MPSFGKRSRTELETCHPQLQQLFNEVIKTFDCAVIEGHRSPERQEQLFMGGRSRTMNSKHLKSPSHAVDVVPYPVDWDNTRKFYFFGGLVCSIAQKLEIPIRWGGDWDGDNEFDDQTFHDLGHFELDDD